MKFREIPSSESRVVPCERTERRTGMTKLRVAFRKIANAPKRLSCNLITWRGGNTRNTGYTQKNGAVWKVNKKFISHLTRAQRTPPAAATVQVSHALPTVRFSYLLRGREASFQDGVAAGKDFLCAPFWGFQVCDYSAAWVSCTV